jgi:Rod binding domain-containing protein
MKTEPVNTTPITPTPQQQQKLAQAQSAAHEFEALFNSMMLRAMRKTVGQNGLIPQSTGEEIYTEMLDDEYAKIMSNTSSSGLADLVLKELASSDSDLAAGLNALTGLKASASQLQALSVPGATGNSTASEWNSIFSSVNQWDGLISEASDATGVEKSLIAGVIAAESAGNPWAVSHAGAKGLMQLMDTTAQSLGVTQSFNPRSNILGGAKYLQALLQRFNGSEKLALASYNAGPETVTRYGDVPPYQETQDYIARVQKFKQNFAGTAAADATGTLKQPETKDLK